MDLLLHSELVMAMLLTKCSLVHHFVMAACGDISIQ